MANVFYLKKAVETLKFEYPFHAGFHWGTMTDATNYNAILFNKEFAKKVWPSDPEDENSWEYHLETMVTSDDPLKYFKENTNF